PRTAAPAAPAPPVGPAGHADALGGPAGLDHPPGQPDGHLKGGLVHVHQADLPGPEVVGGDEVGQQAAGEHGAAGADQDQRAAPDHQPTTRTSTPRARSASTSSGSASDEVTSSAMRS